MRWLQAEEIEVSQQIILRVSYIKRPKNATGEENPKTKKRVFEFSRWICFTNSSGSRGWSGTADSAWAALRNSHLWERTERLFFRHFSSFHTFFLNTLFSQLEFISFYHFHHVHVLFPFKAPISTGLSSALQEPDLDPKSVLQWDTAASSSHHPALCAICPIQTIRHISKLC